MLNRSGIYTACSEAVLRLLPSGVTQVLLLVIYSKSFGGMHSQKDDFCSYNVALSAIVLLS